MSSSHVLTIVATVALLSVAAATGATEPSADASQSAAIAQTSGAATSPKSSRLRFRSGGPACMCVSGMSEAEIAGAAERRRRQSADSLENIIQNPLR